tara:strand:+ start:3979 stop:4224 length:246 start_codon:yes stop_codon:yes gene_type:complete
MGLITPSKEKFDRKSVATGSQGSARKILSGAIDKLDVFKHLKQRDQKKLNKIKAQMKTTDTNMSNARTVSALKKKDSVFKY